MNCSATVLIIFSRVCESLIISFHHCFCVYDSHFHNFICLALALDHCSILRKPIHPWKFCRKTAFRVRGPFSGRCLAKTNQTYPRELNPVIVSLFIQDTLKHSYLVTSSQYPFFLLLLCFLVRTSAISSPQNVWNFPFQLLPKELTQLCPHGLSVPSRFLAIACTTDVILPDIAKVFHILSTQAGYEELAERFEPIRNGDIFWVINNLRYKLVLRII